MPATPGGPVRIEWLRTALDNLEQEARYIAADDPEAARRVVTRILHAVALLAEQPNLGRAGRIHGTRELVIPGTSYLVPYRTRDHTVQILRVFHTSRHTPTKW